MANITYSRTFQHVPWRDGIDAVAADGDNGFNRIFHELEGEFDKISKVVRNLDHAIDELEARGVPDNSVTDKKIVDNAVTPPKIPNGSLSADKLVNQTLPLSKFKTTTFTGRSFVPALGDQEIEIAGLSGVEGHTFILASVIPLPRPTAVVGGVMLEWKLHVLVEAGDWRHFIAVHNFSTFREEVEYKVYVLAES